MKQRRNLANNNLFGWLKAKQKGTVAIIVNYFSEEKGDSMAERLDSFEVVQANARSMNFFRNINCHGKSLCPSYWIHVQQLEDVEKDWRR